MPVAMNALAAGDSDTQLHTIRDLMLSAAQRGAWLTLGEIAGLTEIGEASISAQLRHLRKWRHGGHRVEKRRRRRSPPGDGHPRPAEAPFPRGARAADKRRSGGVARMWEYRVLPPAGWDAIASPRPGDAQWQAPSAISTSEIRSLAQPSGTEEAHRIENGRSETEHDGDGASASSPQPAAGEVSDAEACD